MEKDASVWGSLHDTKLKILGGHAGPVNCVAVSKNLSFIVSGSEDTTVRVWVVRSGKLEWKLVGHARSVSAVAISEDSKSIASGSSDGIVLVWNAEIGSATHILKQHEHPIFSVAISKNGRRVVSGSSDNARLCLWDLFPDGKRSGRQLHRHVEAITCIAFSEYEDCIVTGSVDGSVNIWSALTGNCLAHMEGDTHRTASVGFSSDSRFIYAASIYQGVRVWEIKSTTVRNHSLLYPCEERAKSIKLSSCSKGTISSFEDGSILIRDLSGTVLCRLDGGAGSINDVAISDCGTIVAAAGEDKTLKVWDSSDLQAVSVSEETEDEETNEEVDLENASYSGERSRDSVDKGSLRVRRSTRTKVSHKSCPCCRNK